MPPPPAPSTAALNALWAGLLVEELRRQGAAFAVVSPGSRSTPLALAVARSGIPHLVCTDERGAAFAALGAARATGRPSLVVCTSGTAVANFLPAVVEAGADGVSMILLTADRPAELRHTGANQTIDQIGIFGPHVRFAFDLPAPSPDVDPAFVLTTAALAARHATRPPAGPVHLNVPFREPLAPAPDAPPAPEPPHIAAWRASGQPYTSSADGARVADVGPLADAFAGIERGLVIAGAGADPYHAYLLADRLGWPLLPDIRSGARLGADSRLTCAHYDLALASDRFAAAHRPDAVVEIGRLPVSKRLGAFLASARPRVWATIADGPMRLDPAHAVTHHLDGDPFRTTSALVDAFDVPTGGPSADRAWPSAWRRASDAVAGVLAAAYDTRADVTEAGVARALVRAVPEGETFVVGASMPIRDVDQAAPVDGARVDVIANRGASGIDGTVATAAGAARASGRGAAVLVGDLTLLHDIGSLGLLREGPRVVVVVVNNDGGGIFSFLPVAERAPDAFEAYFGTPHGLGFEHAARMFGLGYAAPATMKAFQTDLRAAFERGTSSIIEVQTDRSVNHALHLDVQARVRAAVDAAIEDQATDARQAG